MCSAACCGSGRPGGSWRNHACGRSRWCRAEGFSVCFFFLFVFNKFSWNAAALHQAAPSAGKRNHCTVSQLTLTWGRVPRFPLEGHTRWRSPAGPAAPHSELSLRPHARRTGWSANGSTQRLSSPVSPHPPHPPPPLFCPAHTAKGKDHSGRGTVAALANCSAQLQWVCETQARKVK